MIDRYVFVIGHEKRNHFSITKNKHIDYGAHSNQQQQKKCPCFTIMMNSHHSHPNRFSIFLWSSSQRESPYLRSRLLETLMIDYKSLQSFSSRFSHETASQTFVFFIRNRFSFSFQIQSFLTAYWDIDKKNIGIHTTTKHRNIHM